MNDHAVETLSWMKGLRAEDPSYLFRGQNRLYPTIKPSVTREHADTRKAVLGLCHELHRYAGGITGYQLGDRSDELALVQHYLECSPMLDLTGTPEVALSFALGRRKEATGPRVVYAFKKTDLEAASLRVVDHDFLLLPIGEDGHRCRWIRQDGFGVCAKRWFECDFDLLEVDHVALAFGSRNESDDLSSTTKDLLSPDGDPIFEVLRGNLFNLAAHLEIVDRLSEVFSRVGISDPYDDIAAGIDALRARARRASRDDLVQTLRQLGRAHLTRNWDTSHEAALAYCRDEMKGE